MNILLVLIPVTLLIVLIAIGHRRVLLGGESPAIRGHGQSCRIAIDGR
jgi:hypothetical protein